MGTQNKRFGAIGDLNPLEAGRKQLQTAIDNGKMMLSNVIKTDETVETSQGGALDAELQAKMGTKFLKLFNAEV